MAVSDVKLPELHPGSVMVKMKACGICGSDLTAYQGTNKTVRYPVHGIGHEGVGVVEDMGNLDEKKADFAVGDRVVLEPYIPCGECHSCKKGHYNNCLNLKVAGVHTDGMMAEFCSYPADRVYRLPDSVNDYRAALIEPLSIALHGIDRAGVKAGEYCLITGAGPIGLLAAFGVLSRGGIPILTDILEKRLAFAKEKGIPHVFHNKNGGLKDYLTEVTGGKLPECMVECTGSEWILKNMHEYVCHGGNIALVGWAKEPVSVNTIRCMQKELNLFPSRNSSGNFPEAIQLICEGRIPVDDMTTRIIPMEEVEAVIRDMINRPQDYLKVVVDIEI